jgi:2'-5' RNA ligase
LTLFLPECSSLEIEKCREKFNYEQFQLIKAHITLCREDEIEQLEEIKINLNKLSFNSFDLEIGKPTQFCDQNGVLIPIVGNDKIFHSLRAEVLNGIIDFPRIHKPHITLMHPGNSSCTPNIFKAIKNLNFPNKIQLSKISLIEQNLGGRWYILEEYRLRD